LAAVELSPAHVLHARRYGDTSLLVELFGPTTGRCAGIAKGALSPKGSASRLQPFQPLLIALRGRGEVQTLTTCETAGPTRQLAGTRLYCGFYLNELLMKLTARSDPNPPLYQTYVETLDDLHRAETPDPVLRRFEVELLAHLGHRLVLETDCVGQRLDTDATYVYHIDRGPERVQGGTPGAYPGALFQALHAGSFTTPEIQRDARLFMRWILDHHLEGRPIRSRELFR
jgi:DNA repair protein RecO (recombination protein O)